MARSRSDEAEAAVGRRGAGVLSGGMAGEGL
jgi:hypothetical protein